MKNFTCVQDIGNLKSALASIAPGCPQLLCRMDECNGL